MKEFGMGPTIPTNCENIDSSTRPSSFAVPVQLTLFKRSSGDGRVENQASFRTLRDQLPSCIRHASLGGCDAAPGMDDFALARELSCGRQHRTHERYGHIDGG